MDLPDVVEKAKSGRSRCGVCKQVIAKGETRVGTRRMAFGGFLQATWHHEECIKRPWRGDGPSYSAAEKGRFAKAARLAVRDQVQTFRALAFASNGSPRCPISGKTLSAADAHVHHIGPMDFDRIVVIFVEENGVDLSRVSYTAGQFSSASLCGTFSQFHTQKARLLLVHASENLSTLKGHPSTVGGILLRSSAEKCWALRAKTWGTPPSRRCRTRSTSILHQ